MNIAEQKYLNKTSVEKVFPPYIAPNGKKYHIDLIPLRPKIGNIPGEKLSLTATFSIESSKKDASFNVANVCTYFNTLDPIEIQAQEKIERQRFKSENPSGDVEKHIKNWYLLDNERYYKQNSFNFKIKSCSQFTNDELVKIACKTIVNGLENIKNTQYEIKPFECKIDNCYDILLDGIDYTLGNVINHILLHKYGEIITFSAFKLVHPHDPFGTLRVALNMDTVSDINLYINKSCDVAIEIFEKIEKLF
jgi:DNA-directed RNA polymerase subunit L